MKGRTVFVFFHCFWILGIFFFFGNFMHQANADEIYVPDDYPIIQEAIDAARDGDFVVVRQGRYTGEGNINLNFKGKAICVRSLDPSNHDLIRNTIIDAEGKGIIVQFINDEGPKSVFAGFTLIGGDTSEKVQGVPGYFRFSEKAQPTTMSLRIGEDSSSVENQDLANIKKIRFREGSQYDNRVWNGNNPFHHPFATTRYYGSGDIDCDGDVDSEDLTLAQEIINGQRDPYPTADVNADMQIDNEDIDLINSAINGSRLFSWWNDLNDLSERNFWIDRFLSIDQTDKHPYAKNWFVCRNFADQLSLHASGCRTDLYHSPYDGGETLFNLPMYIVRLVCSNPPFGHYINAILIGDDPLDFKDWRFIEPQTDNWVHPGMWSMPYGTELTIISPDITGETDLDNEKAVFYVDESGCILKRCFPYFLSERPNPSPRTLDNRYDFWNPRIIPFGSGKILYNRLRDDMTRMNDIHLADLPFTEAHSDIALILSSQFSRLLDICTGSDETIHLLWQGKPNYKPCIFYGQLDLTSRSVKNIETISTFNCWQDIRMARLIITPENHIHAFWFSHSFALGSDPIGIYWSYKAESGWQGPQNLIPNIVRDSQYQNFSNMENRDLLRYFFDVTLGGEGSIFLVWCKQKSYPEDSELHYRTYKNGSWSAENLIEADHIRGVKLCTDFYGKVHLFQWTGDRQSNISEGRGNLEHLIFNGSQWTGLTIIDNTGEACCPWAASGNEGEIYLVWERKINDQVVPVFKKYIDNAWNSDHILFVNKGSDAWYPLVEVLADGRPVFAWSSRSSDRVTIETMESAVFANFYSNITSGHAPLDVTFTDYSGFDIISWQWDFGDGESSTEKNPSHIYHNPGTYNVSLTVTNSEGSDTRTRSNYIIVSSPPPPPAINIQEAINNAQEGEEIIVPEGIYLENINFLGKAITVRSTDPNDPEVVESTVIDGNQNGSVVTFNMGEGASSVLKGITLRNGKAYKGGGIHCSNASSPTIVNCVITNCESISMGSEYNGEGGGGVYSNNSSSPQIINSVITGNSATSFGGGIFCDNASPSIDHCTISGNNSEDGAGIAFRKSSSNISDCQIMNNSINGGNGAGIYCYESPVTINNCMITQNITEGASGKGGGIYCEQSSPNIKNSIITENSVNINGGGIYGLLSSPVIVNCIINENSTFGLGGGLSFRYSSPVKIINSTITGNSAQEAGGVFLLLSDLFIVNSIFWGDLPDEIYFSGNLEINYSNIQGGYEGIGNINLDPFFIDPSIGDFHLKRCSPCINVGTSSEAPSEDKEGNVRPSGDGYDMGAYEFPGNPLATYYEDKDSDGFGNPNIVAISCSMPLGYIDNRYDCNDEDPNIHSGAIEKCNGVDDDCDGTIDNGFDVGTPCSAGIGECKSSGSMVCSVDAAGTLCNAVPGNPVGEICDGLDNNCDGAIDNGTNAQGCYIYYKDADQDGFGVTEESLCLCAPEGLYTATQGTDEDDSDPRIPCLFTAVITATGQPMTDTENVSVVYIGIDTNQLALESQEPIQDYTVYMNLGNENGLLYDYRKVGTEHEEWQLIVRVEDKADPNKPYYFPLLSWDTNNLCSPEPNERYFRLYAEDAKGNLSLRVADMTKTSKYQTKEEDGLCLFGSGQNQSILKYHIIWSSEMAVEMSLPSGWSMISLPVFPANAMPSSLFPQAVVLYRYEKDIGYTRIKKYENLEVGQGYWIFLNEEQTQIITGQPIHAYTKTFYSDGWEMIGGCTYPAQATAGCEIDVIYRFNPEMGYELLHAGDPLNPAQGYWILCIEMVNSCKLTVQSLTK